MASRDPHHDGAVSESEGGAGATGRYAYLTFDCYGTLIDWRKGIERNLRRAMGPVTVPKGQSLLPIFLELETREESKYKRYRDVLAETALKVAEKLGARMTDSASERFAGSVPTWPAFQDTASSLRRLGKLGYSRFILSNVDTDLLKKTIRRNALEVDGFVTAEEIRSYKPRPGHWRSFLRRTGARKEDVLHVAQSIYHDIRAVRKLGIDSAWVNRYGEPMPEDVSPNMISDNLAHLVSLLAG